MPVEIKPLKGFVNPINNESNTLSLLVKSDYELNEHLHESKQKLVISLTSIINHLKDAQEINFYHKLEIPSFYKGKLDYPRTRYYKMSSNSLERDLDDSFKDVIRLCSNRFNSHFVNVVAKKNSEVLKLDKDNFLEVNHIIRDAISNIKKYQYLFVDNIPFEKTMRKIEKKNRYIVKQTKIVNKRYRSVLKQHIEYLTL